MLINNLHRSVSAAYQDWSDHLNDPRYIRQSNTITWHDYDNEKARVASTVKISDVLRLTNDKQFTFQVIEDEALIQLYYAFDRHGKTLREANLAYYNSGATSTQNVSDMQDSDLLQEARTLQDKALYQELYLDLLHINPTGDVPVNWLRIDFAPDDARGVLHHDCHMHISGFPHARLAVMGVPTPRQFIEFIMALCYPHIYRIHRELDENGSYPNEDTVISINTPSIPLENTSLSRSMTHVCVPFNKKGTHGSQEITHL